MHRALFLVLIAVTPSIGWADPSAADRAAAEAEALAKSGNYAAAAARFRTAWQADKVRTELFCNIGISFYKGKDLVRAHALLEQCLQQAALDPKVVDAVRRALRSVEGVLRTSGHAPVRFVVEPSATAVEVVEFAPDIAFVGSRVVWLPFGTFHAVARAEGYADTTVEVTLRSAAVRTVAIELRRREPAQSPPLPAARSSAAVAPATTAQSSVAVAPRTVVSSDRARTRRSMAPAIATTAVSALAAGVAIYAAVEGNTRATLAGSALDKAAYDADRRAVSNWNTTAVVAGAACAIGAIGSGYLWYRALHSDETRIAPHAAGHELGIAVTGRF